MRKKKYSLQALGVHIRLNIIMLYISILILKRLTLRYIILMLQYSIKGGTKYE